MAGSVAAATAAAAREVAATAVEVVEAAREVERALKENWAAARVATRATVARAIGERKA